MTRERIRQIEAKALRKLKHPSRSDKLRSFHRLFISKYMPCALVEYSGARRY